jgi:hypothetical protein
MHHQAINYLPHYQIDKKKWDKCIDTASNGLIYGYSFYLDAMATSWDVLVLNDYEAVMPLPRRKKFGIHYIYQPAFTAQLGVFGNDLNEDTIAAFLKTIPGKFSYCDLSLNHQNLFSIDGFPFQHRMNYVLPLGKGHNILYDRYRQNIKRNIKKAVSYHCTVKKEIDVSSIIELAKQHANSASEEDFNRFKTLYSILKEKGLAKTYGVFSDRDQLLASAVYFFSHKRAYYILVGNHPNGRTLGASHLLIDAFIEDHSGKNITLDFEGSDLRNLAFFYSSFGATEEKYPALHLNRLPWYLKWLKK